MGQAFLFSVAAGLCGLLAGAVVAALAAPCAHTLLQRHCPALVPLVFGAVRTCAALGTELAAKRGAGSSLRLFMSVVGEN